ncbi:PQQ-binding-like beta-propeller repeat protein [Haladaptatus pallidirubidus]|uniref:outer membrane protein assembly factor BamB family protein n=1 Tax=Haladaptatus pallidirubidus TaxID=1008152 RepID=UPI0035E59057
MSEKPSHIEGGELPANVLENHRYRNGCDELRQQHFHRPKCERSRLETTGRLDRPRAGPSRTGVTDQNGPTPYAVTDWRIDLDGSMYDTDPVVADETLYLSVTTNNTPGEYGGYIGAYDAETGDEQWKRPDLPAPKTPAIDDQTIYFSTQVPETPDSDDIGFHALDADSGDTVWNRTDHNHWSHPIVTENKIYTSNRDATFALHRETGDTIWKAGGVSGFSDDVGDALSYTDGTLFVSDGTALDAEDGSTKWAVSSDECTLGNPAVHNGMIYYTQTEHIVGDDDRVKVQARSAETGEVEWVHREDGNAWDGRPAITENHVLFVNSSDGESIVTALDSTTGETVWATMIRGTSFSSPVVGNGTVYLGGQYVPESDPSAGRALIHALDDATGDQLWSYLLGSSGLETSPEDPLPPERPSWRTERCTSRRTQQVRRWTISTSTTPISSSSTRAPCNRTKTTDFQKRTNRTAETTLLTWRRVSRRFRTSIGATLTPETSSNSSPPVRREATSDTSGTSTATVDTRRPEVRSVSPFRPSIR